MSIDMLNYFRWICTVLPVIVLLTISVDGGRVKAQRENVLAGRIRDRIQIYRERRQQEQSQKSTQSSGANGLISHKLNVGGIDREYYLYIPANLRSSQSVPLVIGLHGGHGQPQRFAQTTKFNELAQKQGFIVAYPAGIDRNWNDGRDSKTLPTQDDVAFIRAVIDDIQKTQQIDPNRVYATGISNGGFMTQRLACELSDRISAFASVASTMAAPPSSACKSSSPVPMLTINSPVDKFVPWQGGTMTRGEGGTILSVAETSDFWRTKNGCTQKPLPKIVTSKAPDDGTKVEVVDDRTCQSGKEVVRVTILGGGHTWPSGSNQPTGLVGVTSNQIDATTYIWDFFQRSRK
jgi:polyhydroxybutyrate depolymerase